MFFRPGLDDHGLPHNPFKAIVSPRPIAWVSTIDKHGRANLAPFSFFNGVTDVPPMVMFCPNGTKVIMDEVKDTLANIRDTGEFVVNMVSYALRDAMNLSSGTYARGVDEFESAGLVKGQSRVVAPPYVKDAPAVLECVLWKEVLMPKGGVMILGEVKGIHMQDEFIRDGIFDVTAYQPIARLGYKDYAVVTELFSLTRPGQK